jgi:hypothetical protein
MTIYDKVVDINSEEDLDKIEETFKKYNVTEYKIDFDIAYDSCGYDVYYYAVSYIWNNELKMTTGTWESC